MNKLRLKSNNPLLVKVILLAIMFWLGIPSEHAAAGNVYYVDFDNGDNSYDGLTPGTAWKECPGTVDPVDSDTSGWTTIGKGDTVIFTAGQIWTRPITISSAHFSIPTQESERITLTSSAMTRAIFDLSGYTERSGNFKNCIILVRLDYISLEYLELGNLSGPGRIHALKNYTYNEADYLKIKYCYIHDILDTSGRLSYGIGVQSDDIEIAYCDFKNVEAKLINVDTAQPGYVTERLDIHHNLIHQDADFAGTGLDHGMVITAEDSDVYNNIFWAEEVGTCPSYAVKIDGNGDGSEASNNRIYNNLILKWPAGIGVFDANASLGNENKIIGNTIYLQNADEGTDCTGQEYARILNGISLRGDGGENYSNYAIVRNNIIYYPRLSTARFEPSSCWDVAVMMQFGTNSNVSNNIVTDNLFYYDGSSERFALGERCYTMEEVESSWHGTNNNTFENNIIASPAFSGGIHPVLNLPAGFSSDWSSPDNTGLELTAGSQAIDNGEALASPYNVDMRGVSRPQGSGWDIGAYEYISATSTGDPNGDGNPEQIQNYLLSQNYPNPFNPATTIRYSIPKAVNSEKLAPAKLSEAGSIVNLKVYDVLGKEAATLVNEQQRPGVYEVKWDASHLSSGVYYYKLQAGSFSQVKKLILMK